MDQLSPKEKLNLDTFSSESTIQTDYDREGFNHCETCIVEKYMSVKGKVLDLGCGAGRTAKPFYDRGYEVIAVDLSESMINFAKKKYKEIDFRVMNACDLKFEDNYFDYVFFSFNGIDYIHPAEKRVRCLQEVYRILKKGGLFIYSSHSALNIPRNRAMLSLGLRNLLNFNSFTKYRIEPTPNGNLMTYHSTPFFEKKVLENNGFDVLEIRGSKHINSLLTNFLELAPYYVARKNHE